MATQLGLVFLVWLLVSNVVAALWLQRTGTLMHPLSRMHALTVLHTAAEAARQLTPGQAEGVLHTLRGKASTFWISDVPDVAPFDMREEEQRLAGELAARLGLPSQAPVSMQLERITGDPARAFVFTPAGWAPLRLRTSVRLPDGRWLNGVQHPSGGYEWRRMLAYSLPVSTLPVLLLVLFAVYRVVRPIQRLADATERFSRGERVPFSTTQGPQEARELAQAFEVMQDRITRHVTGRTRMLAAISHDFNTPITALRLNVELLPESSERDDMLESLDELRYMVRETLDFVRGDAVQEPAQSISLNALIDDLARRYQALGHPLDWPGGPPVQGVFRPVTFRRALSNLIDNALRHGGNAALRLQRTADGMARLEIQDRGPGLDPAMLEHVFEPFVQATGSGDNPSRQGLGLGLAIARAGVQAHGGELFLENRPPAGLCAVVLLPLGTVART